MRDNQDFDTTPAAEECAQVGCDNYEEISKLEAGLMMKMIHRHAKPPEGISMKIRWNEHDFGRYPTIIVFYDSDNDKHQRFLNRVEELPETWDSDLAFELDEMKALITQ
jgi:hypothetical protein